ncbi:MAG: hypothetical protein Q8Q14_14065 [Gemmatimonadales bacterium]|nr:hypothetical protein [Gemmatimonadales bacterium]
MQHYATASTIYNFGRVGIHGLGAPSATWEGQVPSRSQEVWMAEAKNLATKVSDLRVFVVQGGAVNEGVKQMILAIIDTQARPALLQTTVLEQHADAGGYWTRAIESGYAKQMTLARNAYGAALGMQATTGGKVPPSLMPDLATTAKPGAPGITPVATAGMGVGTMAALGLLAWWLFLR